MSGAHWLCALGVFLALNVGAALGFFLSAWLRRNDLEGASPPENGPAPDRGDRPKRRTKLL